MIDIKLSVVENLVDSLNSQLLSIIDSIGVEKSKYSISVGINNTSCWIEIDGKHIDFAGNITSKTRRQIESYILGAMNLKGFLFMCVQNSARSQLAEAIARHYAPKSVFIASAGSNPSVVRDEVFVVLKEKGIDTNGLYSKSVNQIDPSKIDAVITLCAEEVCPVYLHKAYRVHWGMPDPAKQSDDAIRLDSFRSVRDEIDFLVSSIFD